MCDLNGNVLGHPTKVTKEYFDLVRDTFEINFAAFPCICSAINGLGFRNTIVLPYDIRADLPFTIWKRITDKIKILRNIRICLRQKTDALFFAGRFFLFPISLDVLSKGRK